MLRAINNVNEIQVPSNKDAQTTVTTNFRANDYERTPDKDTLEISSKDDSNNNSNKNWLIGLGVAAALATVGIIGYKQGWFTKAVKDAKSEAEEKAKEEAKNTVKDLVLSKVPRKEKSLADKINALNKYLDETEKLPLNATESEIKIAFRKAAMKANAQNDEKALMKINSIYQDISKGAKKGTPKQSEPVSQTTLRNEAEIQGKLNYELKIDGNTFYVENGKIVKSVNSNNEVWKITDKTDKAFVEKINNEINKKNKEILEETKPLQKTETNN